MFDLTANLLAIASYMPHGNCYLWQPGLMKLHWISDALIALSYYSIPITIIYFLRKRPDIPFHWIFQLFAAFIIACGTGHILSVWTLWHPNYWLSGFVEAITASISVVTAVLLVILFPKALALPSPEQMKQANQLLEKEVSERKQTAEQLKQALQQLNFHVENSPVAVIEWDNHFCVKRWSKKAVEIFGWQPQEVIGKNPDQWKFIFPQDLKQVEQVIASLIDGSQPHNTILNRNYNKEGSVVYCEWYNSVSLDNSGQLESVLSLILDVTERQKGEIALKQQEQKLRSVIENMPVMMDAIDEEGNFIVWNKECERVTGFSAQEIVNQPDALTKLYPESSYHNFMMSQWQKKEKNYRSWEWEMTAKDNSVRTVAWSNISDQFPIPGWESWSIGVDITERKRAENLLEEQKQTLKALLNNAPIWIWMTDTQGKMQFVNKTFCENVGVPESKFLQASHYKKILGESESANCVASDAACLAQENPHFSEETLPFVDGKYHELEIIKAKIKDRNEQVTGIIGLAVDSTAKKQAQRQIGLSEARYREIAQREKLFNSVVTQIRTSLNLNTILQTTVNRIRELFAIDLCIFLWYRKDFNQPFWQVVTQSKAEGVPNQLGIYPALEIGEWTEEIFQRELIQIDDITRVKSQPIQRFFQSLNYKSLLAVPTRTQQGQPGVIACIRCSSPRPWAKSQVKLLKALATPVAIAIEQAELYNQSKEATTKAQAQAEKIEQTLHELRRTQTQLIQSEKMSSLGQMVGGVAHEINNPVNFIYGNVAHAKEYTHDLLELLNLWETHYPKPVTAVCQAQKEIDWDFIKSDLPKLLGSMKMGAERIRQIVLSLRNFSRLDESGAKEVDLHEGLDNTLLILQNRLRFSSGRNNRSEITVTKEYGDLPPITCHAGQINQVFMNLLSNAIDALDQENHQVPNIHIRTLLNNGWVAISIKDNGPGMTAEVASKLFDPFFTTKPIGKGTGLGLSISYQIVVERHQGNITCISEPGKGAEFIVEIPVRTIS
ncbi:MAG: PAS domain S-box protein [Spirulinaceae cyanobacterium]